MHLIHIGHHVGNRVSMTNPRTGVGARESLVLDYYSRDTCVFKNRCILPKKVLFWAHPIR